jgi:peptidyl-tRNA hydrolase
VEAVDIEELSQSSERIKIGILPETPTGKVKKPSGEDKVVKFILGQFQADEMKRVKKVIAQVPEIVEVIIKDGVLEAMNRFN